jgi:hypothetical protein
MRFVMLNLNQSFAACYLFMRVAFLAPTADRCAFKISGTPIPDILIGYLIISGAPVPYILKRATKAKAKIGERQN